MDGWMDGEIKRKISYKYWILIKCLLYTIKHKDKDLVYLKKKTKKNKQWCLYKRRKITQSKERKILLLNCNIYEPHRQLTAIHPLYIFL